MVCKMMKNHHMLVCKMMKKHQSVQEMFDHSDHETTWKIITTEGSMNSKRNKTTTVPPPDNQNIHNFSCNKPYMYVSY